jgi:hypothetical protein
MAPAGAATKKMRLTSTQIGLLAENLVINALLIVSGGRLVPFRPVADDYGIDLLLYDKTTGRALPLQVKARTKTLKRSGCEERGDVVHFEVREVALRNKGVTRLLGVLLNEEMTTITAAWLMPLPDVERIGSKRNQKLVIRPSRAENSHDKFRAYFLPSIQSLVTKLLTEFEQLDRTFAAVG